MGIDNRPSERVSILEAINAILGSLVFLFFVWCVVIDALAWMGGERRRFLTTTLLFGSRRERAALFGRLLVGFSIGLAKGIIMMPVEATKAAIRRIRSNRSDET
ncbi:hypothetical protein HYV74_02030 [Candidatus Uhrbacteria bacterium]|nr:hypothetical protein [Candidatus Uhrbacteria bacterium]